MRGHHTHAMTLIGISVRSSAQAAQLLRTQDRHRGGDPRGRGDGGPHRGGLHSRGGRHWGKGPGRPDAGLL